MEINKLNCKSNKLNKEKRKKGRKFKEKTLNDIARAKCKGYSKNMVAQRSIHFRPTSQIKEFLDLQDDKSKTIREAIELLMKKRMNIDLFLDELCINYPLNWRRINRRNGLFLKYKIKELKNG